MNIQDMENSIADTTGNISEPESGPEDYTCTCGAEFSDRDVGVSVTLKRCALCYAIIRNELGCGEPSTPATSGVLSDVRVESFSDAADCVADAAVATSALNVGIFASGAADVDAIHKAATAGVVDAGTSAVAADHANADVDGVTTGAVDRAAAAASADSAASVDGTGDATNGYCCPEGFSLCMEEIEVAMAAAVSNAIRCFSIILNGRSELFTYFVDPVEVGTRKLFKRISWLFALLYWYEIFGGMMTTRGKTLVTPCAVRDKKGNIYILMAIGKTLCNRPRYDGLIVALESKTASFVQNIGSFVSECLLNFPFDGFLMDR